MQNEQIKADYEKYKEAVSKIQVRHVKKQYEVLLNDFAHQINIIEQAHSTYNNGYIDPKNNRENIIRLTQIRMQLQKLLKD